MPERQIVVLRSLDPKAVVYFRPYEPRCPASGSLATACEGGFPCPSCGAILKLEEEGISFKIPEHPSEPCRDQLLIRTYQGPDLEIRDLNLLLAEIRYLEAWRLAWQGSGKSRP